MQTSTRPLEILSFFLDKYLLYSPCHYRMKYRELNNVWMETANNLRLLSLMTSHKTLWKTSFSFKTYREICLCKCIQHLWRSDGLPYCFHEYHPRPRLTPFFLETPVSIIAIYMKGITSNSFSYSKLIENFYKWGECQQKIGSELVNYLWTHTLVKS